MIAMLMMMTIIMTVEMNYVEDTIILDNRRQYQMMMIKKNYFADTTISKERSNSEEELLRRYNDLRTPLFQDILPSLPLPLRRPDIEKEYDDTFLKPPQSPTLETLKTDLDRPITNLIDKANNVIGMIPKSEKQDLDKYDLHLSEQLSKLFSKVEEGSGKFVGQDNDDDQKTNELPIPELTEILSKIDKREVPKQLEFFEGGKNKEFEEKVKLIGLSTDPIEFLEFLQSDFCQEIFIENQLKIHIVTGNIFSTT